MWNQTYQERLRRLLELDLKFLCPWKDDSGCSKLSKSFRACFISPLILLLIMTSFVYHEWGALSFATVAENMAFAIAMARSCGYSIIVKKFYGDYKKQVEKLFDDRKSLPLQSKQQAMTEGYCRTEFLLSVAYHLNCFCVIFVLFHVFVCFSPNDNSLPFNCFMVFLPPDGFLFAWELNYFVLTVTATLTSLFIISYVPLPFLLMNQSCWLLDMALITADDLNERLQPDDDICESERVADTNENLKKFVERCEKLVEWQSEVQVLLFWFFNLEFQVQSLMLCFSIYVLSLTFSGGIILLMFVICATQIFVLCWMGTRVTSRINRLSFEISKNWYLMTLKQRKTLQMILHWTQTMEGFRGTFKDVSLKTCKEIFEAAYSFYAFLNSTNGV